MQMKGTNHITLALMLATCALLWGIATFLGGPRAGIYAHIKEKTSISISPLSQVGQMNAYAVHSTAIMQAARALPVSTPQVQWLTAYIQQHRVYCAGLGNVLPLQLAELGSPFHICMYAMRAGSKALLTHLKKVTPLDPHIQALEQNVQADIIRLGNPSQDVCRPRTHITSKEKKEKAQLFAPFNLLATSLKSSNTTAWWWAERKYYLPSIVLLLLALHILLSPYRRPRLQLSGAKNE